MPVCTPLFGRMGHNEAQRGVHSPVFYVPNGENSVNSRSVMCETPVYTLGS